MANLLKSHRLYVVMMLMLQLITIINGQWQQQQPQQPQQPQVQPPPTQPPQPQSVIVPNYDNIEYKMKFFDDRYREPLMLMCNVTIAGQYNITWMRNGVNIELDPQLRGRYKLYDSEYKFIIEYPDSTDAGNYTCNVNGEIAELNVISNVYFRSFPENTHLIDGQKLVLHCIVFGTDPQIEWIVGNQTLNSSTDRILLSTDYKGIENAILTIESVVFTDRQIYNCTVRNLATSIGGYRLNSIITLLRIRDRMAPVWPVCGMAIEAFILFIILFLYERYREHDEDENCTLDDMFRPVEETEQKYTVIRNKN